MEFKHILLQKEPGIGIITLNRPEVLNALNTRLLEELSQVFEILKDDPEVDAIILTGSGKAFCAGNDLEEMGSVSPLDPRHPSYVGFETLDHLMALPQPLIGAINGYAITGGLELALACDIIIAAEDAAFRDTHALVGVVPGLGSIQKLPRIVGIPNAMQMVLTSKFITAQEALRLGIVSEVVPGENLLIRAREIAHQIMAADRRTVRLLKKLIREGTEMELGKALLTGRLECKHSLVTQSAEDIRQRVEKMLSTNKR